MIKTNHDHGLSKLPRLFYDCFSEGYCSCYAEVHQSANYIGHDIVMSKAVPELLSPYTELRKPGNCVLRHHPVF